MKTVACGVAVNATSVSARTYASRSCGTTSLRMNERMDVA